MKILQCVKNSRRTLAAQRVARPSLWRAREGSVAMMLATGIGALVIIAGVAVDLGRAYMIRNRAQHAVDAAVLSVTAMVGRPGINIQTEFANVFRANFPPGYAGSVETASPNAVETPPGSGIYEGTVGLRVPPSIIHAFATTDMVVRAKAKRFPEKALEMSLVLDTSSSMRGRMPDLINATHHMMDIIFGNRNVVTDEFGNPRVFVSVVPFAGSVNLDAPAGIAAVERRDWMRREDWPAADPMQRFLTNQHIYDLSKYAVRRLHPCANSGARGAPFTPAQTYAEQPLTAYGGAGSAHYLLEISDAYPDPANPDTQFYAPERPYLTASMSNNRLSCPLPRYTKPAGRLSTREDIEAFWNQDFPPVPLRQQPGFWPEARKYHGDGQDPPNGLFPIRVAVSGKNGIKAILDALENRTQAGTNLSLIRWGWFTLSPKWQGKWENGKPDFPLTADPDRVRKVLIFQTDGLNANAPGPSGPPSNNPATAFILNDRDTTMDLCDAIKAEGIEIFVVGYSSTPLDDTLLKYCASKPENFHLAEDAAQLDGAFRTIANELSDQPRLIE